ncbi:MAG: GNAT family N-acetyltransferase [Caulobacteraceae bacterium]|nr:GNAT family N-acetyltransferase [Caulobacteraceae bacterium]
MGDPRVTEHMDIDPLIDLAGAGGIIAWAQDIAAAGTGVRWAILADEALIGTCGLQNIECERGSRGEVAYDLSPAWWGRGVMAEVLPALLRHGFETLGLRRLEAFVNPGNARSERLLLRHAFFLEGTLRDYAFWRGRFWDQQIYARLAD